MAVAGLRFFYHGTLRRPSTGFVIPAAREPSKLPHISSHEELMRLFSRTRLLEHRALLLTAYAAGLRVREVGVQAASRVVREPLDFLPV